MTRRTSNKVAVAAALGLMVSVSGAAPLTARGQGVSRSEIRIGVHAPMTGAVPLPNESIQMGADVFWRWRRAKDRPIHGRHVEVIVKNDNYNPSQAVAVCKELVQKRNVFMLSGLLNPDGKDQVQACARYAASVGVPYVSLGQTTVALRDLPNYFTFSMTWRAQARLLADLLSSRLGARREANAILRFDSPNHQDTYRSFLDAMERRGAEVTYDRAVSRTAGQTEAQAVVQEMKAQDIENIFVLVSPVWFMQVLQAADTNDYHPTWTGVGTGISMFDAVVKTGCRGSDSLGGAKFLSPLPAFADRNDFDGRYSRAMRRLYGEQGDAFTWLGWATSKQLARLLDNAGRDLSRKLFVRRTERAERVRTGVMPTLNFTPKDHFGARRTHVLTARCRQDAWVTTARFKRRF